MEDSRKHIVELQSLRGIAAVAVMIGHSLDYFQQPAWFPSDLFKLFNGRGAVAIFFVLSGFVLTRSLAAKRCTFVEVGRFYTLRFFRIFPAIWAASALGLGYLFFLHWRIPVADASEGVMRQFRADRMDVLHIAASLAGMLAFILPQLWSITVEIFASATIPFVAALAFRRRRAFAVFLALTAVASFLLADRTYYNVGMYYVEFVLGAGLAVFPPFLANYLKNQARISLLLFTISSLLLIPSQFIPLSYYDPRTNLLEAVLASVIIATLTFSSAKIGFMRSKAMLFLGDISYSLYLVHYVVVCVLAKLIVVMFGPRIVGLEAVVAAFALALFVPVFAVPMAALSYNFVELPGVRLGRQVLERAQKMKYRIVWTQ